MILTIGEILADVIAAQKENTLEASFHCGGAPFNVAVHAKRAGGKVCFVGRVGKDSVGKFLQSVAEKEGLDVLELQIDSERNTSIAFVTLKDGERDFTFLRHNCADYYIDLSSLKHYNDVSIVHLGSLMLSENVGQEKAMEIANWCRESGKLLSFDVNYRQDVFESESQAKRAYGQFVDLADLVKLSKDEAVLLTGVDCVQKAARLLSRKDKLIVITLGSDGSYFYLNEMEGFVPSQKVKPIDTTGAGDAFWGTVLAELDGKDISALSSEELTNALKKANSMGAACTLIMGAI